MLPSYARPALVAGVLVLAGTAALPASASAIAVVVESSQITTPSSGTFLFAEEGRKLEVKGTAKGTSAVDIRCYFGPTATAFTTVMDNVSVQGEDFEADVSLASMHDAVCQLRAIPHEETPAGLGPGEELAGPPPFERPVPFEGPLLATSRFEAQTQDFFAAAATFAGSAFFESAGVFGFESALYSPLAHEDVHIFFGNDFLPAFPAVPSRSAVQVDGVDAYTPGAALTLREVVESVFPLPGTPSVTVSRSFDEATHQLTIHEEDPLVRCAPGAGVFPPTKQSCTTLVSAGVALVRTWQSADESHVALMTDTWRSTDGAPHAVDARYSEELRSGTGAAKEGGVYRFPGEASFAATHDRETKTLPVGAGMILYKTGTAVPDSGDGIHPQGGIVFDSAPAGPIAVLGGSDGPEFNAFEMPYQRTVPAGGSSAPLRMAFVQSFALGEVLALSEAVLASFSPASTNQPAGAVADASAGQAPPAGTHATAAALGAASGRDGRIRLALACHGTAGQACSVALRASALERLGAGRVVGIAASRRARRVVVASATVTIPAGRSATVTVALNRTGRGLLARFGRLPASLSATLLDPSGHSLTILRARVTVRPAAGHRRHR